MTSILVALHRTGGEVGGGREEGRSGISKEMGLPSTGTLKPWTLSTFLMLSEKISRFFGEFFFLGGSIFGKHGYTAFSFCFLFCLFLRLFVSVSVQTENLNTLQTI